MKKRVLKWLGALLIALIGLLVAADFVSARYLKGYRERYQREVAEIKQRDASYRRPAFFGEPLEQNAAVWYRRALPHLTGTNQALLKPALDAGFEGYDNATTSLITEQCAEAHSIRVRNALRCTHCNWDLGFDIASPNRFEDSIGAIALARCMTIDGHRAACKRAWSEAAQLYLQAVAIGCDLGIGNETMLITGMGSASLGLLSLATLVTTIDDARFLDDLSIDLAKFDGRLPDARLALQRERLWVENAISDDELEAPDGRFRGFGGLATRRTFAAAGLFRERVFMRRSGDVIAINERRQGLKLADDLKGVSQNGNSEIVRGGTDLARDALVAVTAIEVVGLFRATQAAIALQQ